jgi:cobalamin biosynthesis Mg chelatase CobN
LLACRTGGRGEGARYASSLTMRKLPALAAACLCLLAAFAPAAAHASASQILRDCNLHGHLTGHYSQKDLANALAQLQGDQSEYTDCEASIKAAQAADARQAAASHQHHGSTHGATNGGGTTGGGTSSGAGASTAAAASHAPTKADQNAIHRAASQPGSVALPGGESISPTNSSATGSSGLHAMPVPLRVVLILLAAGALAGAGLGLRRRVLDRRTDT